MDFSKSYFVYITCNRPRGVLYVGMTSDLPGRAWEHHHRAIEGFTAKFWADRMVYFEEHADAASAAHREHAMKRWRRDWKIRLVEATNPTWRDLYQEILVAAGYET